MKISATAIVIVAIGAAMATALVGWWAVPVVGAAWASRRAARWPVFEAACGAGLAWVALLGLTALQGDIGRLASRVGSVFGLPGSALAAITVVFASGLAASAAAVTTAVVRRRREVVSTRSAT